MEALNKLALHEAYNSHAYGEIELYQWDPIFLSGVTLDWTSRPAKKVVLKMKAGYRATFVGDPYEDTDYIMIQINGLSDNNKVIKVDVTNGLPFTLEGLLISEFRVLMYIGYSVDGDTSRDHIDIISYH